MTVADDYPAVAILHDAWTSRDRTNETPPQAVQMFQEITRLRAAATASLDLAERLRAECDTWMNGVADAVEPFGFDRQAASGPADLLPGLTTMRDALIESQIDIYELTVRLERHPVTTGGHRIIPQAGSNLCVCGEWFDAEIHQADIKVKP